MSLTHAQLAAAVIAVLILCGVAAWSYVFVAGLRHSAAVTPDGSKVFTVLADPEFRAAHRNHLHFADVCFFGAAAVAASMYLNG